MLVETVSFEKWRAAAYGIGGDRPRGHFNTTYANKRF